MTNEINLWNWHILGGYMAKKIFCFAGGIYFSIALIGAAQGHALLAELCIIGLAFSVWQARGD